MSQNETPSLVQCADDARTWLTAHAFPLWIAHGVDWANGGFFDSLDPRTLGNAARIKRLRTVTRQVYAFSVAAGLGVPRAREAVDHGLAFLFGSARAPNGGFLSAFDLSGRPTGVALDTYDLAFVLFALRHALGLTGDLRCKQEADDLLAFMEAELRDRRGGFREGRPGGLPRRQNPHMHLFEACLAWTEVEPDGPFRRVADELFGLFTDRFVDPETGAVLEYFGPDLRPDPSIGRDTVEPGHIFEWIWLLDSYGELTGTSTDEAIGRLHAFGHRHGRDARTDLLAGELDRAGGVRDRSVRLWPHAEWLRGELALRRREPARGEANAQAAYGALRRFLDAAPPGLWAERYDAAAGAFAAGPAPATSLYHIVGALTALLERPASRKSSRSDGG